MLPDAAQVADPFHVVKLAYTALNECGAACRTRTPATEAANTTRSTAPGVTWRWYARGSPMPDTTG